MGAASAQSESRRVQRHVAFSSLSPIHLGDSRCLQHICSAVRHHSGDYSEDCLTLSVYAPYPTGKSSQIRLKRKSAGLPIIVWIYGGGFNAGGENITYQIPTQWVQRSESHIVVTINYRTNIFGFPNSAALPGGQQNLGLWTNEPRWNGYKRTSRHLVETRCESHYG